MLNMPSRYSAAKEEPDRVGTPSPLLGAVGGAMGGAG